MVKDAVRRPAEKLSQGPAGNQPRHQSGQSEQWKGGVDCGNDAFGHPRINSPYRKIFQHGPIADQDGRLIEKPDIKSIKEEIARDIRNYEERYASPNQGVNGRGTIPEGLIRHILEVEKPTVNYLQEFEDCMQTIASTGRVEEDFSRPHPIFAAYEQLVQQNYFSEPPIPETYIYRSCSLGIIVDTSGSVSDAEIAYARESVGEILNRQQFSNAYLCSVDADVHFCEEISDITPDMLRGNGGTDLVRGFEALAEKDVDAILVFTDLQTPWPTTPIDVPVVVVSHHPRNENVPEEYEFFQLENPQLKTMLDAIRETAFQFEYNSSYFTGHGYPAGYGYTDGSSNGQAVPAQSSNASMPPLSHLRYSFGR